MNRLNLLPVELKKEIELSKRNAKIAQNLWELLAFFFIMVGILIMVGTVVKAKETINVAEKDVVAAEINDWKGTETGATDFASRLNVISKIQANEINWPAVISEVTNSIPANVRLSLLDFTGNGTKRITFGGYAVSDKDVVIFRELLSKSKIFEYVDIETITESSDPLVPSSKIKSFIITANLKANEVKNE